MRKTAAAIALSLSLAGPTARAQMPGAPPRGATSTPPSTLLPGSAGTPSGPPRAEPPPSKAPLPRGAILEEVSGQVKELDRKAYKLTIESVSGPVTLTLDRNTMVYTANGLGTVLDLAPGQQIRAGRNADFLAYWVQLRVARAEPSPTPGQGTGPAGGGAAPATESTGRGAAPTTPPGSTPGAVPPGPAPSGGGTNPGQ